MEGVGLHMPSPQAMTNSRLCTIGSVGALASFAEPETKGHTTSQFAKQRTKIPNPLASEGFSDASLDGRREGQMAEDTPTFLS